ncbi:MAG: S-adenosyl-l-methionine hydroxide adenosyltransferase family protein [Vampirovibrionia bacterium]
MSNIIALLTDFGDMDGFVGTVKGVILSKAPEAKIVDISHNVKPQDINAASWILTSSYKYFPAGTIFVCVVDPGVGSNRKQILVKVDQYYFIGPDNGFMTRILDKCIPDVIVDLNNPQFWLDDVKQTFHGRDIFAPVAARLFNDKKGLSYFGSVIPIEDIVKLDLQYPYLKDNKIFGVVDYIDHFGNAITNIPESLINHKKIAVSCDRLHLDSLATSYSAVEVGEPLAIIGSDGYLELALNCGNLVEKFNLSVNDSVVIELLPD